MKQYASPALKRFHETRTCRAIAQLLVFLLIVEGFPFPLLSQTHQWSPEPIQNSIEAFLAMMDHGASAQAASLIDFASLTLTKNRIEDRTDMQHA